jgi:hypothetical protein
MNKYELKDQERKLLRAAEVEASLQANILKSPLYSELCINYSRALTFENLGQEGAKGKATEKSKDESDSSDSSDEDEVDAEKAEMLDREQKLVGQQIDTGRIGMQAMCVCVCVCVCVCEYTMPLLR